MSIFTKSTITGSGSIGGWLKRSKFTIAATSATTCTPADRIAGVRISTLEVWRKAIAYRLGVGAGAAGLPPAAGAGLLSAPSPSRPSWRKPESITTPITSIMRP